MQTHDCSLPSRKPKNDPHLIDLVPILASRGAPPRPLGEDRDKKFTESVQDLRGAGRTCEDPASYE